MGNSTLVSSDWETAAQAADALARRAQPQTAASRLTLRDYQDVITDMAYAAHALGAGIEDRFAPALPPRFRDVARDAGAKILFAAGYLDEAEAAMARDLHALRSRDPGNLDGRLTRDRTRWVARASGRFRVACEHLRGEGEADACVELLWGVCVNFRSAVNYAALLTDQASERALGCTSSALTPLIAAQKEIAAAGRRADVLRAVSQG